MGGRQSRIARLRDLSHRSMEDRRARTRSAAEATQEESDPSWHADDHGATEVEDEDDMIGPELAEGESDSGDEHVDGSLLWQILGAARSSPALAQRLARFPSLTTWRPPPMDHALAAELSRDTAAVAPRTPPPMPTLARAHSGGTPRAGAAACGGAPRGGVMRPAELLLLRESGGGQLAPAQRAHFVGFHRLPTKPTKQPDSMNSRCYIGRFTASGDIFVAAFQDERRIKMYDVHSGWRLLKSVHARQLRWTFTDCCLSSDENFLLYSTISSTLHLVNVRRDSGNQQVESVANITDVHESLNLGDSDGDRNGIWSIRWSHDSREIIAGTADAGVYIYDLQQGKTVVRCYGHEDEDVNAVAYADESSNVFFSGSDDHMVKVWDRRLLDGSRRRAQPVGVFVGHTEGVTHIDSKGDGRYLISNSKDQTVRLWDVRSTRTPREAAALSRADVPSFRWDYRWQGYPAAGRVVTHPHDGSIQVFRGHHQVHSTLIRAYWSPAATTGQRYIYCGSSNGRVCIYDVVTARPVHKLHYHREVVRDLSWHPNLPLLATCSFDGSIVLWEPEVPGEAEAEADICLAGGGAQKRPRNSSRRSLPHPGNDQLGSWR